MFVRKFAVSFIVAGLLASTLSAQVTETPAERLKKAQEREEMIQRFVESAVAEIPSLRLTGNRAVVYGLTADIYWRFDPDRGRGLFRDGAGELLNFQVEAERERQERANEPNQPIEAYDPTDPRFEFLNTVAGRDVELALELMYQTRPAALAEAMAKMGQTPAAGSGNGTSLMNDPYTARAGQEVAMEEQFKMRIASRDPEKAAKAIRDSLAKGISVSVMSLLQSIIQQDEKLAAELGSEVVSKITSTDLSKNSNDMNGAIGILGFAARAPQRSINSRMKNFSFNEGQARDIGLKIANTLLMASPPAFVNNSMQRALPLLEKLTPEKVVLLRTRDAQNKRAAAANNQRAGNAPARQWNPDSSPEEIIAAAGKITNNPRDRMNALQTAANKIGQITDEARAKRLIDSIPDNAIRAQASDRFENNRINRLTVEGRLDEVRASIATLTNKRMQIQRMVTLAANFHRKNTEKDRETATALMNEARAMTNPFPEDEDELADLMELVRGYSTVDPDTGFRLFEPMIDQFNDVINASGVLSRFNKRDRNFKKGEMVMRMAGNPGLLPFRFVPHFQSLARADIERMNSLSDRFQRTDARLLVKLVVLQAYARSMPVPPQPRQP